MNMYVNFNRKFFFHCSVLITCLFQRLVLMLNNITNGAMRCCIAQLFCIAFRLKNKSLSCFAESLYSCGKSYFPLRFTEMPRIKYRYVS